MFADSCVSLVDLRVKVLVYNLSVMSLRNHCLLGFNLFWGAKLYRIKAQPNAAGRDRTKDPSVRSHMLYHYATTPQCRIGLSDRDGYKTY